MRFQLVPERHPMRAAVEACASSAYGRVFNARLTSFPRLMAATIGSTGAIEAVVGLRRHADGFFCAQYLGVCPIARLFETPSERVLDDAVVEITTLAGSKPAALLHMVRSLCAWLPTQGYAWGIFTATDRIRRLLRAISLPYWELTAATADRVSNAADWGAYYETDPIVCAVARDWITNSRHRPHHAHVLDDAAA